MKRYKTRYTPPHRKASKQPKQSKSHEKIESLHFHTNPIQYSTIYTPFNSHTIQHQIIQYKHLIVGVLLFGLICKYHNLLSIKKYG